MPITQDDPFKGRQHPGEVIVLCVRWYLRFPLSYEHVSELLAERGVEVDASCIWRWVQAYAPELNKRCRPYLKPTNKSYRIDETAVLQLSICGCEVAQRGCMPGTQAASSNTLLMN